MCDADDARAFRQSDRLSRSYPSCQLKSHLLEKSSDFPDGEINRTS